jgi:GAF domain-containing protein
MSATHDSTLADVRRSNADLQRERAELRRTLDERTHERDEALQREAATAEVLQVINSSPGNLALVFDAIIEQAVHLCGAAFGALFISQDEHFRAVAMRGGTEAWRDRMRTDGFRVSETPVSAPLVAGERFVHIADLAQIGHPMVQAAVASVGARTFLSVPLRKDDELRGMIVASRAEVRPYSDREIALLQNFAAQAIIAMENARLITETREALEQQTATAEVLQVINSSPGDLAPVFDAMLEKALRLCGAAFGMLGIYKGEDVYETVATRNAPPQLAELLSEPVYLGPETGMGRLVRGECFVHLHDAADDEVYRLGNPARRVLVDVAGARTYLAVPLRKGESFLGGFTIYRQEVRPFTDKQIALLQNFAAQAVIAMENARLLGELRTRTNDLEESLEYQTATSDVLKIISRADAKIEAVLDTLVRRASQVCEADQAVLHQLRDGLHYVVASFGFTPEYEEYVARNPIKPGRGTAIGRMSLESRVIHIDDVLQDREYTGSEFQRLAGFRTLLAVPLLREDAVIGSLLLTRLKVEPFSEKQIEQVRTFADQAAIANRERTAPGRTAPTHR